MTRLTPPARLRRLAGLAAVAVLLPLVAACTGSSAAAPAVPAPADTVRLGYFANVTHATPNVGVAQGFFAEALGATELQTRVFSAGPAAVEAIFAGSIDAAYVGPNPAVNAFVRSGGEAVRIVAGATSGGAALVVRDGIDEADDLEGARIASPQLGGTQDVALRAWLADHGLRTKLRGSGGDVSVLPQENAQTLELFRAGEIDGAWVPEPWASRLVLEGGGQVLVDERDLWPGGRFVTTQLLVATDFLERHPQTVRALVEASVATNAWIGANRDRAAGVLNDELARHTSKRLDDAVIDRAFANVTVTDDPIAASLARSAAAAVDVGVLKKADLDGIYDLTILNEVLGAAGRPAVDDAGLGSR